MSDPLEHAHEELLRAAVGPLRSLDPARELATTLPELGRTICGGTSDEASCAFADGLARLALAELDAFPGNLFWDFDALAFAVWNEAPGDAAAITRRFAEFRAVQRLYGRATPIRFRYVHDFSYGFDWAKWIAREPTLQAAPPGPHDARFLAHMDRRAHELLDLVEADDIEYPKLRDEGHRNPFPFSREPVDEITLHRELARRGQIPVEAWKLRPKAVWSRDYQALRIACADELGIILVRAPSG